MSVCSFEGKLEKKEKFIYLSVHPEKHFLNKRKLTYFLMKKLHFLMKKIIKKSTFHFE